MKEGRPVEMPNRQRGLAVSFYLDTDIATALNDIKWRERKSMSEIVRLAVQDYIKAHAEGNYSFKLDNWQVDPTFQAVPTILSDPIKWYDYLKECSPDERSKILKSANIIRNNAINIGNLRRK